MFKKFQDSSATDLTLRTIGTETTLLTSNDSPYSSNDLNSKSANVASAQITIKTKYDPAKDDKEMSEEATREQDKPMNEGIVGFSLNSSFDESNTSSTNCLTSIQLHSHAKLCNKTKETAGSIKNQNTTSNNSDNFKEADLKKKNEADFVNDIKAEEQVALLLNSDRPNEISNHEIPKLGAEYHNNHLNNQLNVNKRIILEDNNQNDNKSESSCDKDQTICSCLVEKCEIIEKKSKIKNNTSYERKNKTQNSSFIRVKEYFEDIRCFTFFMCLIVMLTNALGVGYRNSVVTTIEKRYEFSSVFSGVLSGCLEIGSLITTLFVSYFCAKSHIPRCIAISSLCCAIGSLLYSLPHLLSGSYTINNKVMNKTTNDLLCRTPSTTTSSAILATAIHDIDNVNSSSLAQKHSASSSSNLPSSAVISFLNSLDINSNCLLKPSNFGHFTILILANILIGSSSAPLYTLGTSYIDNHVTKDNSSIYLAFMYSMLAFGPVVGYLAGAAILQIYVDSFRYSTKDLNITVDDPHWIGAWFLGFIFFGILIFITSFPFLLFPKEIRKNRKQVENEQQAITLVATQGPSHQSDVNAVINENSFGNLKSLPHAVKNILLNKVFMIVTLGYCFEITIISGFMTFLPKYIEHQFSVGNSLANIYTGGVAIPGACVGIVAGGFLVKKFKINPKGASIMAIVCCILCLIGIVFLIFLGCPNIKMAGTTTSYMSYPNDKLKLNLKKIELDEFNLTSKCNRDCQCSTSYIEPICGRNGITYFSPCYAGCKESRLDDSNGYSKDERKKHLYGSCSCIVEDLTRNSTFKNKDINSTPHAQSGLCSFDCNTLAPFLVTLFVITLLTALNQMPMLMVTLRSVSEIERPFALGLQLVIMRLLAYIPSPLIFGKAIDWTCLVWRRDECDQVGSCLFYDREKFRHLYGSIAAFYKVISLFLFTLLYLTVRKYNFNQHQHHDEPNNSNNAETKIVIYNKNENNLI